MQGDMFEPAKLPVAFRNQGASQTLAHRGQTEPKAKVVARDKYPSGQDNEDGRGRRDTSIAAYREVPLQDKEVEVMRFILARPEVKDWTRSELACAMGWRDGPVCGRVNALVAKGRLIEGERRACALSGKQAHSVRAA